MWVGEPDRGNGPNQPGGWLYSTLPYIEQRSLHDLGAGGTVQQKQQAVVQMVHTMLPISQCPGRRRLGLYPSASNVLSYYAGGTKNTSDNLVARTDYAANCGDGIPAMRSGPARGRTPVP